MKERREVGTRDIRPEAPQKEGSHLTKSLFATNAI